MASASKLRFYVKNFLSRGVEKNKSDSHLPFLFQKNRRCVGVSFGRLQSIRKIMTLLATNISHLVKRVIIKHTLGGDMWSFPGGYPSAAKTNRQVGQTSVSSPFFRARNVTCSLAAIKSSQSRLEPWSFHEKIGMEIGGEFYPTFTKLGIWQCILLSLSLGFPLSI